MVSIVGSCSGEMVVVVSIRLGIRSTPSAASGLLAPRASSRRWDVGRDAEIQQLTDDRASPSLGPVVPATVIDDHSSCDDY